MSTDHSPGHSPFGTPGCAVSSSTSPPTQCLQAGLPAAAAERCNLGGWQIQTQASGCFQIPAGSLPYFPPGDCVQPTDE